MDTLNLYLHIPFCRARCHYCDFNTFTGQAARQGEYVRALIDEIRGWGRAVRAEPARIGAPRTETVFFGGGTPSLLAPDEIAAILAAIREEFWVVDPEVTMEANPGTVDRAGLRAFREAGVNRISFGVQVFDDALLAAIGREHDAATARHAVEDARAAGFDNLNLDLIYGLPGQDLAGWRATLREAIALDVGHLSTYGLTIEPGTRFGREHAAGRIQAIDSDLAADMVEAADDLLPAAGYGRYEIANFARPGRECRHNLTYWRNEPFLGLGAGAHSSTVDGRFADHRPLGRYIKEAAGWAGPVFAGDSMIPATGGPIDWVEPLDPATQRSETMILGLRLAEGASRSVFRSRFGEDPVDHWRQTIADLVELGALEVTPERVRLTTRGRMVGDEVFVRFLAPSLQKR